jgi:hypothetical protein
MRLPFERVGPRRADSLLVTPGRAPASSSACTPTGAPSPPSRHSVHSHFSPTDVIAATSDSPCCLDSTTSRAAAGGHLLPTGPPHGCRAGAAGIDKDGPQRRSGRSLKRSRTRLNRSSTWSNDNLATARPERPSRSTAASSWLPRRSLALRSLAGQEGNAGDW